ncbi:hypothetical protein BH11PSE11_BH11PSE11_18430 [soil metagenome]
MEKVLKGVALIVILAVFGMALFIALDTPLGATRDATGVVIASSPVTSKTGPSKQTARVTLDSGEEVAASVDPGLYVRPGQTVLVREYSGMFTATKVYGIFARKEEK